MNQINKYLFLVALQWFAVVASAQTTDPLDSYLKMAAQNNPELRATFNQYQAALERLPQAKALPDPNVMFSVFASPVETRVGAQRAGISIAQAFPWFGQLSDQEEAASQLAKARYEVFTDVKNKLFFDVSANYYDLYVLEASIRITRENVRLLESFRQLANVRLESNTGNAVDLLRVEMELEELNNQLLFLQDTRLPIQARFNELLNSQSQVEIILPDTLAPIAIRASKNILLDSIKAQNPMLKSFEHEILALDAEKEVARKMGLPSFSLGLAYTNISPRADVSMPDNGKDALIFPQVGVRIPLYRNKYKSMVQEKEYLKTSVSDRKENKENQLETALEKSWRDYSDAARRVALYHRLIRYANQALDILVTQYSTAGRDFEEILRMDRQLLRYELELERARTDQNTFVASINYLTGKQL